jgi:hypothetical protein
MSCSTLNVMLNFGGLEEITVFCVTDVGACCMPSDRIQGLFPKIGHIFSITF